MTRWTIGLYVISVSRLQKRDNRSMVALKKKVKIALKLVSYKRYTMDLSTCKVWTHPLDSVLPASKTQTPARKAKVKASEVQTQDRIDLSIEDMTIEQIEQLLANTKSITGKKD